MAAAAKAVLSVEAVGKNNISGLASQRSACLSYIAQEFVLFGMLTDWEKGPKSSKRRPSAYIWYGRAAFVQKGKSLAQQAFAGIVSDAAVNF